MKLEKYNKTEEERKRYTIDYSEWLAPGEIVTDVEFTVSPTTASPLLVDDDSINDDEDGVIFYVSGGLERTKYTVIVKMTTSLQEIKEDSIQFDIKAP